MIKTHNLTGLKYLCYTRSSGAYYDNYKGSGKIWKRHIKKYGDDIKTELLFETDDFQKFKDYAIETSIKLDIVNSNDWANLKIEEGDGGDTVSNKRWITNGSIDKYLNKDLPLPEGWSFGRSNCVFNNSVIQSQFAKRQSKESRSDIIKKCWEDGKMAKRDHKKCGSKGDNNPSKRPEVQQKISIALKKYNDRRKNNKD